MLEDANGKMVTHYEMQGTMTEEGCVEAEQSMLVNSQCLLLFMKGRSDSCSA